MNGLKHVQGHVLCLCGGCTMFGHVLIVADFALGCSTLVLHNKSPRDLLGIKYLKNSKKKDTVNKT